MPSTYSGNPSSTPKDAVRFLIEDTAAPFKFSDEEILFLLETEANMYMAAAICCDKIVTMITSGGLSSKSLGSLSESYSEGSISFYEKQAAKWRTRGRGHQRPWQEEISQKFSFRQFDSPAAGPGVRDDNGITVTTEDD